MGNSFKSWLALFGLLLVHSVERCRSIEIDLTVQLEPGVRECFHQFIAKDIEYDVEYQVGEFFFLFLLELRFLSLIVTPYLV